MKKFFENIKNNPLTIVFAIIGGGVMGFSAYKLAQLYFVALPQWVYILIAVVAAILTVVLVVVLGWDNLKSAILRHAKKTLSDDGYNQLVDMVDSLKASEDEQAEIAAANAAHDKEVERARQVVAEYEKRTAEYEKARALLSGESTPTAPTATTDAAADTANTSEDETPSILT